MGREQHSLAGGGGTQFGRLDKKSGTLYTLCVKTVPLYSGKYVKQVHVYVFTVQSFWIVYKFLKSDGNFTIKL